MDHFQGNSGDYAYAVASDAKREADKGKERIAYLEKRVDRLEKTVNSLLKDRKHPR